MIGYIKGTVEEIWSDCIILDRDGVGFRIFVPAFSGRDGLSVGDQVKLYTYFSVKEDSISLYGFARRDDMELFKLMTGVSGIGPKAALGILSTMSGDQLKAAVLLGDAASIAKAPQIGKKTAQKLILELKDKFSPDDIADMSGESPIPAADDSVLDEAVAALTGLGYSVAESRSAVKKAAAGAEDPDLNYLLKNALKFLY